MRDLVTSDLHLSDNPRDEYRFLFLEQRLPKLIKSYAVDRLYILGDLTEQKNYHSAALVNRCIDALVKIQEGYCQHIVLLRGNHDYEADVDNPFFGFTGYIDGFDYIREPTRTAEHDILLPFNRDPSHWDALKDMDVGSARMILTHYTFKGAIGNNGIPLTGIEPPSTTVPIVSGDVHVPQKFRNITYVGAPYTVDFGDDYQPRVLLRENGRTLTTIKLKGPQKRLIHIDHNGQPNADAFPDDIVKLRVEVQQKDYAHWAETCIRLRNWGAQQGFVIHAIEPVVVQEGQTQQDNARGQPRSDEQLLHDYCLTRDIDEHTEQQGLKLLHDET
jgi:calcineurin-like phosphoesterase family protein